MAVVQPPPAPPSGQTLRAALAQAAQDPALRPHAIVRTVLDADYLGYTLRQWVAAAVVFVVTFAVLLLLRRVLIRRLAESNASASEAGTLALGAIHRTRGAFLLFVAIAAAHSALPNLPDNVDRWVDLVARVALYLQMVSWANGAVAYWLVRARAQRAEHDKAALTSINLLGVIARVALWIVLVLATLDAFGVNVTALVTGLGVAGVAVALAVQSTLSDLLASLSIALDKPFVVGDYIVVDQYQGTVENVGLKTTRIRSLSGEQIVIANAELLKARIRNYQRQQERRVAFTVAFDPGTAAESMARVPPIVREIVRGIPQTRLDRSHFNAITDAALTVETVYFVTSADYNLYMDIQQQINLALLERLRADGIRLAFSGRETVLLNVGASGSPLNGAAPNRAGYEGRASAEKTAS